MSAATMMMTMTTAAGRMVDASEMFGEACRTAIPAVAETAPVPFAATVGSPVFQGFVILLFLCTALLLRDRTGMYVVAESVVRSRLSDDVESGRRDAVISGEYAKTASAAGVLMIMVAAMRCEELWLPEALVPVEWLRLPVAAGCAAAATALIALYERTAIGIIAAVSRGREFAELLLLVKRTFVSAAALFIAPVVLLSALAPEADAVWLPILAVECFILAFLFLKESLTLFLRKNVPIFQWFLYLCTVEAFPLTLAVALTARFR